ncbi:enoyl-CoA hydratase/isomerase family protein [Brevibacillus dissolubilis]|uniref:enoyl-CoA hydratase/isomerase family protein n=1 Tax=Brevibacillus dissolubilis TaxID=1844116 RepID=UPI0011173325|nr:enoyl-CoA hydratase/isomerase family protein [Brevibacillus dissolubilis]
MMEATQVMDVVKVRHVEGVSYIELDYADRKNTLDMKMADALLEAIGQENINPDCKVIVFTSTGRAYFSAGPDVQGLIALTEQERGMYELDEIVSKLNQIILSIYYSPKITIAALHGYAYGGGLNIFLACDYRIAEEKAKFIENFYYMGVTPDLSSSYFLPRLIGESRTMKLLLSGGLFTAKEAESWGLFHEVIEKRSAMMQRVEEFCNQLLTGETDNIVRFKELLRHGQRASLEDQLELEKQYLIDSFAHPGIVERLKNI